SLRPLRSPSPPATGLPAAVLSRRPDVRAAEQTLVEATARVGLQVASRLPTFSLTGAFGTESRELAGMFQGPTETRSLGVDFSVPLLDWGRGAARVEAAEAGVRAAAAEYERAAYQALREVRDALADVRESSAAAASADRVESASRESFRLARARSEAGQGAPGELLLARRRLAESRILVARLRFERAAAHADLCRALGGADPVAPGP
ncbi:MAG: TolC family protein, partial [Opitutales bacterium]